MISKSCPFRIGYQKIRECYNKIFESGMCLLVKSCVIQHKFTGERERERDRDGHQDGNHLISYHASS